MKKGYPLLIVLSAIVLVALVSLLPLERWSGGRIKDFSLVSDLLKETGIIDRSNPGDDQIDPALLEAMEAERAEKAHLEAPDSVLARPVDSIMRPAVSPRRGDLVVIEDYTDHNRGLLRLRTSVREGHARIAVVGDSWIEGDIFTQDLRHLMQEAYGGQGVGYVSMHSDFPGFRRSVKQGGRGWKTFMANKKADRRLLGLSEQYASPQGEALSTYAGTGLFGGQTDAWSRSRFLCLAPEGGSVRLRTQAGEWETRNIAPSDSVVCIELSGTTSGFELSSSTPSLVGLGVWLDTPGGVSLDCMSSRGFSGITLSDISPSLCRQMSRYVDYSLIVLEFGINAMSATQSNYSVYSSRMVEVINHVRACYPRADILLMGVGDRGVKKGGSVVSMATAPDMISAQRDAARRAHCLFWDTREAMGGDGAVVEWSRDGDINKDYIHMTHKGGARLARQLFKAISHDLSPASEAPAAAPEANQNTDNQDL